MSEFLGQMMGQISQVLGLVQGAAGGGLTGVLAQLENGGLAAEVRSWVSHGENLPVTPEQISGAFTDAQLTQWATEAGTSKEALLIVLAEALPHAVDHATPEGKLPE
jgi:uncharacterized protein YidB (DUF937 family)